MKLLKEPLLHFLVLGALLFVIYSAVSDEPAADDKEVVVSAADIQHLARLWQARWMRLPSKQELQGLIDNHVREEILYREALNLGLERDDTVVRRRLVQKLEFLFEDLAGSVEVDEASLTRWYDEHQDDYRVPERLSFVQVFFSTDRRGDAATVDAEQTLLALTADGGAPAGSGRNLGDPSLLQFSYRELSPEEVSRQLGPQFSAAVTQAPVGSWSGPLASSFGFHLVFVEEREPGRQPALGEVRDAVLRDFENARRQEANEAFYDELRARYEVRIEQADIAASGNSS